MFSEKQSPQIWRCKKAGRDLEIGWWSEIPKWCPLPTSLKNTPPKTDENYTGFDRGGTK